MTWGAHLLRAQVVELDEATDVVEVEGLGAQAHAPHPHHAAALVQEIVYRARLRPVSLRLTFGFVAVFCHNYPRYTRT